MQYQKASTELKYPACVLLCMYEWTDHRTKVACKEAQIAEQEYQLDQALGGKERATCEAGVMEKNWVDVQMQHDCKLKKSGKVTWVEEEAKELGKVMIKLCTKSGIKEGAIKDEEAAQEVSGMSSARYV